MDRALWGGIRQSTSEESRDGLTGGEGPAQEGSTDPSGPGGRASCVLTESRHLARHSRENRCTNAPGRGIWQRRYMKCV